MKTRQEQPARASAAAASDLYRTILRLKTTRECKAFFEDLCTPAELEAMRDRWAVVRRLEHGEPYRQIHDETGVSVTTVGRVARTLMQGNGYRIALERSAQT